MASDRRCCKTRLLKPPAEFAKKSCILLEYLLTLDVVVRIIVEHQTSLIGACHVEAGRMDASVKPILPAVRQQLRWALQQPVSMARWHRKEA